MNHEMQILERLTGIRAQFCDGNCGMYNSEHKPERTQLMVDIESLRVSLQDIQGTPRAPARMNQDLTTPNSEPLDLEAVEERWTKTNSWGEYIIHEDIANLVAEVRRLRTQQVTNTDSQLAQATPVAPSSSVEAHEIRENIRAVDFSMSIWEPSEYVICLCGKAVGDTLTPHDASVILAWLKVAWLEIAEDLLKTSPAIQEPTANKARECWDVKTQGGTTRFYNREEAMDFFNSLVPEAFGKLIHWREAIPTPIPQTGKAENEQV